MSSSRKKSTSGTSVKKLIEQEMESQNKAPSIIAKLMGLDALPAQAKSGKTYRAHSASVAIREDNQTETKNGHCGRNVPTTSSFMPVFPSRSGEHREYKDVYEVPPRRYHMRPESLKHERLFRVPSEKREENRTRQERFGSPSERRMELVREKFREAKRLATNHRLLDSKEFQDAIEVLSSNRDLFLKFLEEPNSLFSEYVQQLQSAALPPWQTRRITVLKPSNTLHTPMIDDDDEKMKEGCYLPIQGDDRRERAGGGGKSGLSSGCNHLRDDDNNNKPLPQATRIVVLKPSPSPAKGKMPMSHPQSFPSVLHAEEESLGELLQAHRSMKSRHAVEEEMMGGAVREDNTNNYWYRRDETLLSSVLSNGYTGDESSFNNRSDCEYLEDESDNSIDSDIPSPVTRHSWDCINNSRLDNSPCSLSSFSRMSYSPESSVIREAKKRLSERWVMVTSNELSNDNDEKQVRRSVSTLGEMLAIRGGANRGGGVIMDVASSRTRSYGREEEPNMASTDDINGEVSNALERSNSVPASSSSMSAREPEDVNKVKSGRSSSLKMRVSNFFSSRNKRSGQDKHLLAGARQCSKGNSSGKSSPQLGSCKLNEGSVNTAIGSPSMIRFNQDVQALGSSTEVQASLIAKTSDKAGSESLTEPSPDSVLESPFKDDGSGRGCCFYQGAAADIGCSRTISRSPPIGSIARSLASEGSRVAEKIVPNPPAAARHSLTNFLKAEWEEDERDRFVRKLLSAAGMCGDKDGGEDDDVTTISGVLTLWHSLDSPLSPSLLDRFLERKGEEARCRVRRSNQRLWFDSVNAALSELSWNSSIVIKDADAHWWSAHPQEQGTGLKPPCGGSLTRLVLGRLVSWGGGVEGRAPSSSCEQDTTSQVVDRIVRREVRGGGWVQMRERELWELCGEVEEQLLQAIVEETLVDLNTTSSKRQLR